MEELEGNPYTLSNWYLATPHLALLMVRSHRIASHRLLTRFHV